MQNYKAKFDQLKTIADKKPTEAVEELVLMLHAVNISNGMRCLVDETQYILPINWSTHLQGIYTFIYKLSTDKRVQFRFVDNNDGNLSVNFVIENNQALNQTALKLADGVNSNAEKYQTYLKSVLGGKTTQYTTQSSSRWGNMEPAPLAPNNPPYMPSRPLRIGPTSTTQPFPGGGLFSPNGELVGPDSQMFRGGQGQFYRSQDNPLRIPPGARYDPTNPFDVRGINPDRNDFYGFDQFGRPLGNPPSLGPFGTGQSRGGSGGFRGGDFLQPREFQR